MCTMTATGVRWKRTIPIPEYIGQVNRYVAVMYNGEIRYVFAPPWAEPRQIAWLGEPLYAVRVRRRAG